MPLLIPPREQHRSDQSPGLPLALSGGDVVVTTVAEHDSNLLPWARVATRRHVECGKDGTSTPEDAAVALDQRPVAHSWSPAAASALDLGDVEWAAPPSGRKSARPT